MALDPFEIGSHGHAFKVPIINHTNCLITAGVDNFQTYFCSTKIQLIDRHGIIKTRFLILDLLKAFDSVPMAVPWVGGGPGFCMAATLGRGPMNRFHVVLQDLMDGDRD